ncbi:MAG: hypothetical protein KAU10_06230 [Dehalococcoidia bacterium]|nr:hypothetical protein [Dehalococcoidia bacterium]
MNRKLLAILGSLLVLAVTFTTVPVSAGQQGAVSIGGVSDPGILPGSPFYFLKDWSRAVRLLSVLDAQHKARLSLRFADEDALAIHELCDQREYILGATQCRRFYEQFGEALGWTEQARQEGKDVRGLVDRLKYDHIGQQRILAIVLGKMPEWATQGILFVIDESSAALASTIQDVRGSEEVQQFREELSVQFSELVGETVVETQVAPEEDGSKPQDGSGFVTALAAANHPPEIVSLEADEDMLSPEDECRIECSAEDPDGDSLSYEWKAEKGDISGEGPVVTWIAPRRDGTYDITVVVSDGQGKSATESVTIDVGDTGPPKIKDVIATAEHKYLEESLGGYVILKNRSCDIECVVKGGDRLSYEWEAEKGEISGTGSEITWKAPSGTGRVAIIVTVSDRNGNTDTEITYFTISNCAICFR